MRKINKTYFLDALTDAANWKIFATEEELETLTYNDLKKICVERCLQKHKMFITELEDEIDNLEDEVNDLENTERREMRALESEISELKKSLLPDETLNDVEKIELLHKYWNQFTYDNLKSLLSPL